MRLLLGLLLPRKVGVKEALVRRDALHRLREEVRDRPARAHGELRRAAVAARRDAAAGLHDGSARRAPPRRLWVLEDEFVEEGHQAEVAQRVARVADGLGLGDAACELDHRRVVVAEEARELPQPALLGACVQRVALRPVVAVERLRAAARAALAGRLLALALAPAEGRSAAAAVAAAAR